MTIPTQSETAEADILYSSHNYAMFTRLPHNREIRKRHVEKLAESMKLRGFLRTHPMLVNQSLQVIDGQHRLEAARQVGVPVFYKIVIEGANAESNRDLNSLTAPWNNMDYVKSYAEQGYPEYQKLLAMMAENQLPIVVFTALSTQRSRAIKGGTFICPSGEAVDATIAMIKAVHERHPIVAHNRFTIVALRRIADLPGFSLETMLDRIYSYPTKITGGHNTDSAYGIFLDLYNYRTRERNKLG
jgi:hypothetical protein